MESSVEKMSGGESLRAHQWCLFPASLRPFGLVTMLGDMETHFLVDKLRSEDGIKVNGSKGVVTGEPCLCGNIFI